MPLILASGSPRRLRLLRELDLEPDVMVPDVDESPYPEEIASDHVERLALAKCQAVCARLDGAATPDDPTVVIAADTIVSVDGEILGKPRDHAHSTAHLRQLSGRSHEVLTGIAVAVDDTIRTTVERTAVHFATLSDAEIEWYVQTGEPEDKAGSYAMQGRGGLFVTHIEGSYDNVIGLPRRRLSELLRQMGHRLHS